MDAEKVINDLNVAKIILLNTQMLTPEMNIKIGQVITSAIALLKEQEALVPKRSGGMRPRWWCTCGFEVSEDDKYCHECGRQLKWSFIKNHTGKQDGESLGKDF